MRPYFTATDTSVDLFSFEQFGAYFHSTNLAHRAFDHKLYEIGTEWQHQTEKHTIFDYGGDICTVFVCLCIHILFLFTFNFQPRSMPQSLTIRSAEPTTRIECRNVRDAFVRQIPHIRHKYTVM